MRQRAKMGEARAFLLRHVASKRDECIEWPFAKHRTGYGVFGDKSGTYRVHRLMCKMAHGEPPFLKADAAHSCNNRLCINPRHLRWDTRAGNLADMVDAGTIPRGERHGCAVLTEAIVREAVKSSEPSKSIAAKYDLDPKAIDAVRAGYSWRWLTGLPRRPSRPRQGQNSPNHRLTDDQVTAIYLDARPHREIAADFGCDRSLISRIKSGHLWASVTGHKRAA